MGPCPTEYRSARKPDYRVVFIKGGYYFFTANAAQYFFSEDCENSVYLASSPEVEGITGQFFKNKKIIDYNPRHPIDEYAPALWEKSKELEGLS